MASESQCRSAIEKLVERVGEVDPHTRQGNVPDRTIGCTVLDLDLTYVADVRAGELENLRVESGQFRPQVRLVCSSDDLILLTDGDLSFASAWASGRVRLDASLRDLLRLRNLG